MRLVKHTHKKFEYTPRYYKGKGNPYKIEPTFDKFRKTNSKGIKSKFTNAIEDLKSPQEKSSVKIMLIVVIVLILIFLFIIDFDLSIFSFKK